MSPVTLTAQAFTSIAAYPVGSGFEYDFVVTRGGAPVSEQPMRMAPMINSSTGDGFNMVRVATWTPPNTPGAYTITVHARAMGVAGSDNPVQTASATYTVSGPSIVSASSTTPSGVYNVGKPVNVSLTFNQPVSSSAGLAIGLSSGAVISTGPLSHVSGFSGTYIVAAGESSSSLTVTSVSGTITDVAGNNPAQNPVVPSGANIADTVIIKIDTTSPTLAVTSPVDGAFVNTPSIVVTGSADDANGIQGVTVNGTAAVVTVGGSFTAPVTLAPGTTVITAVATDKAGNTVTAVKSVTLDTVVPVTSIAPAEGTYSGTVTVSLISKPGATIFYTTDGQVPTTQSPVYLGSLVLNAAATTSYTVKYFAKDAAGNIEAVKSAVYTIHVSDLTNAGVKINNGVSSTNSPAVTLSLSATDPSGVSSMYVACDGVTFGSLEPFAVTRNCTLTPGDGIKTVAVKFVDSTGTQYDPVSSQILLDTVVPVTSATPGPGVYGGSVGVALTANKNAVIYYTLDGTVPTRGSAQYSTPLMLTASVTKTIDLKFFAVDQAGNAESVQTRSYTLHIPDLFQAAVSINNGTPYTGTQNVILALAASDSNGVPLMQVACDGVNFSAPEPFAVTRSCTLSAGDGLKTVGVAFIDGLGTVYTAIPAQITLDTQAAVTTATPVAGTYSSSVLVTLTANETSKIYYTTDGSEPVETAANMYSDPFELKPPETTLYTVKYFAVDQAGNKEATKTLAYAVHLSDLTGSIKINNGAPYTAGTSVTLSLLAADPAGIKHMEFSSDGSNFTAPEAYATGKNWTLNPGDGLKTVYVRFTDGTGTTYLFSANIMLAAASAMPSIGDLNGDGLVDIRDALSALRISIGLTAPSLNELVRGDVAPLVNGISVPDGVVDIADALLILRRSIGLVTW